jgi:isohexenylglutaconyl-CoA hydratase
MTEYETLRVEQRGAVLQITLHQPATRNAMSLRMVRELRAALQYAEASQQAAASATPDGEPAAVRVIVLRGAGGHFCSGGDLKDMAAARTQPAADGADPLLAVSAAFGELCAAYAATPLATVAVLEGAVLGGGFGLACAVDLAIASDTAQFRLPETSRGLVPAQIAPFLVERIGYSEAKRLALTGASVAGPRALAIGLVHELVAADALDDAAARAVHALLQAPPGAVAATKALLARARHTPAHELVGHAAEVFASCARGREGSEGMMAFLQKRKPAWAPAESEPSP